MARAPRAPKPGEPLAGAADDEPADAPPAVKATGCVPSDDLYSVWPEEPDTAVTVVSGAGWSPAGAAAAPAMAACEPDVPLNAADTSRSCRPSRSRSPATLRSRRA